jgi:hypothetical protein
MLSHRFLTPVLALVVVIPACATTVIYTDPAAFNTATAALFFTQINFNTATYNSGTGYTDASGAVFSDLLASHNGDLSESSTCANTCPNGELTNSGVYGFAVALPSNIYAFAFYVSAPNGGNVAFNYGNGSYSSTPLSASSTLTFFGATTDAPITNFSIGGKTIDNFEISSGAAAAPEAATLLTIGSGLILFGVLRRRRPRTHPAARRGAVSTMSTGSVRALASVLPANTTSASAPCCVSTR